MTPVAPLASGEPVTVEAVADGAFLTDRDVATTFTFWPTLKVVDGGVVAVFTVTVALEAGDVPPAPEQVME